MSLPFCILCLCHNSAIECTHYALNVVEVTGVGVINIVGAVKASDGARRGWTHYCP